MPRCSSHDLAAGVTVLDVRRRVSVVGRAERAMPCAMALDSIATMQSFPSGTLESMGFSVPIRVGRVSKGGRQEGSWLCDGDSDCPSGTATALC